MKNNIPDVTIIFDDNGDDLITMLEEILYNYIKKRIDDELI